jgi:ABC-2 type transport system ATP-binding protein
VAILLNTNNIIEVKNLTKTFGKFKAVDNISFEVKKGEIFGLLGPNGAGKSTTLRILSTLAKPTSGAANIGGHDIIKEDNQVREMLGIVSEKMIIYDKLTAKENLWFFGCLYGIPKEELNKRIDTLLELVNLTPFKSKQVGTFSTGMLQRMNVIRALLNEPQVLFLDEPTLGLDPQSSVEIRDFVKSLNKEKGTTIIITTHMMVDADILCDRIAIVDHGKIIALDTSANLKKATVGADKRVIKLEVANLDSEMTAKLKTLSCIEALTQEGPTKLRLTVTGENAFNNILDTIRGMGGKISSMENIQPTLEDVFLQITGRNVRDSLEENRNDGFGDPSGGPGGPSGSMSSVRKRGR